MQFPRRAKRAHPLAHAKGRSASRRRWVGRATSKKRVRSVGEN